MDAAKTLTGAKYFHLFLNFFIVLLLFLEGWEGMACVSLPMVFVLFKHTEETSVYSITNKRIVNIL